MYNRYVRKILILLYCFLFIQACIILHLRINLDIVSSQKTILDEKDLIFSDNFDDGDISDWTVSTSGGGTFDISTEKYVSSPYSVHMKSIGNSKAIGESPAYELNLSQEYNVSFNFMIPSSNNHWFEVYNNNQTYLIIDHENDLSYYNGENAYFIKELNISQWYQIELKVHPSSKNYDVYIDHQFHQTCSFWIHGGWEDMFRIGDRATGSTDRGEAFWDDFIICNMSISNNPPELPEFSGKENGTVCLEYYLNITTFDPDGDDIYLNIDWGEGNYSKWFGPFSSGQSVKFSHIYTATGIYCIKVKAKDTYGLQTNWATIKITINPLDDFLCLLLGSITDRGLCGEFTTGHAHNLFILQLRSLSWQRYNNYERLIITRNLLGIMQNQNENSSFLLGIFKAYILLDSRQSSNAILIRSDTCSC